LKTVTRHECLNHLSRHKARWRLFSELAPAGADETGDAFAAALPAPGSPADELEHLEAREQLEEAIRRLPDHQRVPLVLFHLEDMSYQDIASTLGVTLAKVKTDIFRAREALRRHLRADHASR
jgi:RNA polymerase sigma-70 factor (ECF subfamily)